jgi:hypothetical protein
VEVTKLLAENKISECTITEGETLSTASERIEEVYDASYQHSDLSDPRTVLEKQLEKKEPRTGPVDVDEMKPIVDLDDYKEGPVDLDDYLIDSDDDEFIGEFLIDDEGDGFFERQIFGYQDGFEPEVITEYPTSYVARRKFSEDFIPLAIREDEGPSSEHLGTSYEV